AKVPSKVNVGVMEFNGTPTILASPSTDRDAATQAIGQMKPSGGTAAGDAIDTAVSSLRTTPNGQGSAKRQPPPAAIVVLTDGKPTTGRNPVAAARAANSAGIKVYTVVLGTPNGKIKVKGRNGQTQTVPVPPDPAALQQVAQAGGGKSFTAQTTD